jgi:hypothetical protein
MNTKRMWLAALGAILVAGSLSAQEPDAGRVSDQEADDQELQAPDTGRPIRFRANPYDNAYNSAYGRGGYYFGYAPSRSFARDQYSSYYRNRQWARSYGYARFWSNGYSARTRGNLRIGYRRQIGANGDLVLLAPFLAPLGPLAGDYSR